MVRCENGWARVALRGFNPIQHDAVLTFRNAYACHLDVPHLTVGGLDHLQLLNRC